MNIAVFASAFYPSLGGVEELCRQLAHEFRRAGHTAVVFTERWPRSLPDYEEYEGIPVHRIKFRVPAEGLKAKLGYAATTHRIRKHLFALLRRYAIEVLHVQCVSANAFYALEARTALGLPLVLTLQGELSMDANQLFERSKLARNILRRGLREAEAITGCSRQTLSEAEIFFGEPFGSRGRVVYNGIAANEADKVAPFPHPRPYILALGRHVPQKGFDVLLRAMSLLIKREHPCDLILAGDGMEHAALKRLADQLSLGDHVIFPGRVDHPTALRLFAGCELFVLPSRHEPFGIVNLEAMAAGKPVVATRVGGVPEIVVEGENGLLVAPEDPEALAEAIGRLLDDEALRRRLGVTGRAKAQRFSWTAIADEYLNVYRAVRSRSHPVDAVFPAEV